MDIKLRAKLSAYTKLESLQDISNNSSLPDPDETSAGHMMGVDSSGDYTFYPTVSHEDIDSLFMDVINETTVTKDEIDTLFEEDVEIDTVTKDDINSLFEGAKTIETVSHADIDSLFS